MKRYVDMCSLLSLLPFCLLLWGCASTASNPEPEIKLTAQELYDAYKADPKAADAKYRDQFTGSDGLLIYRHVVITGVIRKIYLGGADEQEGRTNAQPRQMSHFLSNDPIIVLKVSDRHADLKLPTPTIMCIFSGEDSKGVLAETKEEQTIHIYGRVLIDTMDISQSVIMYGCHLEQAAQSTK